MKQERIDKILNSISDDEKFRLLYRIELIFLNKKVSSMIGRTNKVGDSFSARRALLYHSFYDGNTTSTQKYDLLDVKMGNGETLCDYFDAKTMFAYANFLSEFCSQYEKIKKEMIRFRIDNGRTLNFDEISNDAFIEAKDKALKLIRKYFKFSDLQIDYNPLAIDVVKQLKPEQRGGVASQLIEQLGVGDLYLGEVYGKILYTEELTKKEKEELEREYAESKTADDGILRNEMGEPIDIEHGYTDEDQDYANGIYEEEME